MNALGPYSSWLFTKEDLHNSPSRRCGYSPEKEADYRQEACCYIQDVGQLLKVNQLCINTAMVYMHRFYVKNSFTKYQKLAISKCALFLAAKVEVQPRELENVIKVAHSCLHRNKPPLDTECDAFLQQAQELLINEEIMLRTLGFEVTIDQPHFHVIECCQLVHANHDLTKAAYLMAMCSLHLTTMCIQYKPTVVACVCIHLACKWTNWEIPQSYEGKPWFKYVDESVTQELLETLTAEFLDIVESCPSRLKRIMMIASGTFEKMTDRAKSPSTSRSGTSSASRDGTSSASRGYLSVHPPDRDNLIDSNEMTSSRSSKAVEKNGVLVSPPSDRKHKKELVQNNPAHRSGAVNSSSSATTSAIKPALPPKMTEDRHSAASKAFPQPAEFPTAQHNSGENHSQPPSTSQQCRNSPASNSGSTVKRVKAKSKEYRANPAMTTATPVTNVESKKPKHQQQQQQHGGSGDQKPQQQHHQGNHEGRSHRIPQTPLKIATVPNRSSKREKKQESKSRDRNKERSLDKQRNAENHPPPQPAQETGKASLKFKITKDRTGTYTISA